MNRKVDAEKLLSVATAPLLTIPIAARLESTHPRATYYLGSALAVAGVVGLWVGR